MSNKIIVYRGGIVEFRIPEDWTEESDTSGGAMYFQDRPDSGTLRVNVIGFDGSSSVDQEDFSFNALKKLRPNADISRLPDGLAVAHYSKTATEGEERLSMNYWEIAVPVRPCHLRVVAFSYATLASRANDRDEQKNLAMLDSAIRAAKYSTAQGPMGDDRR